MIEIFRKGFRLEIPSSQVVTFKKAQNLNGVQASYSYSNTVSLDKTANIRKLLDLPELPIGKVQTLQNGYEVDIVLNGSIQLRNQILKITKETLTKVDLYLLYSDSSLVSKLKSTYINEVVKEIKYKKTVAAFTELELNNVNPAITNALVQTQSAAGQYVAEEMPLLINLQWLIKKMFSDNGYTVYGDFILTNTTLKEYFVAPNAGVYQVYSGAGEGFAPSFDASLTAFDLLNQTLAYFNSYADVDDTYKTVTINQWSNLSNYKSNYVDYSKYYDSYQDYTFQSKLAKKNELTYSGSESTFNSFFTNNLSSEDKATYLASKFGSGSTQLFEDAEVQEDLTIPLRVDGDLGETSALRIYKVSTGYETLAIYEKGVKGFLYARKAVSVSMRDVYNEFHKAYTDFILTPLIQNVVFRYDGILAADFSLTRVFFIEQLASYWIPLEINFSTKKDQIMVKAMLVKQRKVASPILNNFNSVLLDFRQKVIFTKEQLLSMYPMPPNEYAWDEIVFKGYDQNKNSLFVNGVLIPSASLPQAFNLSALSNTSIVIESNKAGDVFADTATDSLYIQAVDTNGGVSNEAYITLKHTGVASLESNFEQSTPYTYSRGNFDQGYVILNILEYVVGPRPNLNNTITSIARQEIVDINSNDSFNLVVSADNYGATTVKIAPFSLYLRTKNGGKGKARASVKIQISDGSTIKTLREYSSGDNQTNTYTTQEITTVVNSFPVGAKIRVYFFFAFNNARGLNSGSMDVEIKINGFNTAITTTKTI